MKSNQKKAIPNNQLEFERLLADISSTFVNISLDKIDQSIKNALKAVSEFLRVDRSAVSEYLGDGLWRCVNVWTAPGLQPRFSVGDTYTNNDYPWIMGKMLRGETVHIPSTENLPDRFWRKKSYYKEYNIKSELDIPIAVSDVVLGEISFVSERVQRDWPSSLIQRCKLIGYIFAGVLLRKRSEMELRKAELCYRTVADFTYDWEYWANPDGSLRYVSPSCQRITGYKQEEFIKNPGLLARIVVTEDQDTWRTHHCESSGDRIGVGIQFRIKKRNGEIRWIEHVCRQVKVGGGENLGVRANNRDITERKETENKLRDALVEIRQLKDRLQTENIYLRHEIEVKYNHQGIIGQGNAIKKVLNIIEHVGGTSSTVLLLGETGTGKELLARAIHSLSDRRERPMVKLNCAALPPTLIESELFGAEKGAYTGAGSARKGRFEIADQSTLFLDEIGEVPMDIQVKLLRVLENGEFERLGGTKTYKSDVRIIAATNKSLEEEVRKGRFREDLYYRLNVFPISVPPLRDRKEDILPLVWTFVREFEKNMGKKIEFISPKSITALHLYSFPGNIRELRNIVERAMIMASGKTLNIRIPSFQQIEEESGLTLEQLEKRHILRILDKTGWRVMGKNGAAEILGLKRTTLYSRMKKIGIRRH
jgi:formate hydrogenlyase transcriptional activator